MAPSEEAAEAEAGAAFEAEPPEAPVRHPKSINTQYLDFYPKHVDLCFVFYVYVPDLLYWVGSEIILRHRSQFTFRDFCFVSGLTSFQNCVLNCC